MKQGLACSMVLRACMHACIEPVRWLTCGARRILHGVRPDVCLVLQPLIVPQVVHLSQDRGI